MRERNFCVLDRSHHRRHTCCSSKSFVKRFIRGMRMLSASNCAHDSLAANGDCSMAVRDPQVLSEKYLNTKLWLEKERSSACQAKKLICYCKGITWPRWPAIPRSNFPPLKPLHSWETHCVSHWTVVYSGFIVKTCLNVIADLFSRADNRVYTAWMSFLFNNKAQI